MLPTKLPTISFSLKTSAQSWPLTDTSMACNTHKDNKRRDTDSTRTGSKHEDTNNKAGGDGDTAHGPSGARSLRTGAAS